jgi:hypothetical protein
MLSDQAAARARDAESGDVAFDVAHVLAPVQATDLEGRPVRLGTLWEDRAAVLVFLRHFG